MPTVVNIRRAQSQPTPNRGDEILSHLDGLYRFAHRLTRNVDDAQELTQETALRAWQQRQTITRNLRAWLFQTLYHAFVSSRRRTGRATELREEDVDALQVLSPIAATTGTLDVRRALEALPENLRVVAWLSDGEQLPLREVAQILDRPLGTVASRLWRARQELRIALSAYGPPKEKDE
jgi:RNA polymerase sigma-70 factor (ECF subfamily)